MVVYAEFVEWSRSADSEMRGQAAHLIAAAYIEHDGPPDEQAALYAALFGFLDDASVKVRAALAYGLLRSKRAPRVIMLAMAKDAPVIARAVLQYSPVLLDADLISLLGEARPEALEVLADRQTLSEPVIRAILAHDDKALHRKLLARTDLYLPGDALMNRVEVARADAALRGLLLARPDLSAAARLMLIEQVRDALKATRIVKGAVAPARLNRLLRDAVDGAASRIGEREAAREDRTYARALHENDRLNTRQLLNALVGGNVMFFADCLSVLSGSPSAKIFALLGDGPRTALNALFQRCGMAPALRNLMARIVILAREADLSEDMAARFFVVTSLVEELVIEHDGRIPEELTAAFAYLNEQNLALARAAARGVMPGFAENGSGHKPMPGVPHVERLALPAA